MKLNPDLYHGQLKETNFFENWYFKLVDKTGAHVIVFIPGIIKSVTGEQHCFLQLINQINHSTDYLRFLSTAFYSNPNRLKLHLNTNIFSYEKIYVNFKTKKNIIHGILYLDQPIKWPDTKVNPGSMGIFNHFDFMDYYHHICALDGLIEQGHLMINGKSYDFTNGRYYIEKKWGEHLLTSWLAIQSNTFNPQHAAITVSLVPIPLPLTKDFYGFFIGLTVDNTFYSFTTLNRSKFELTIQQNEIQMVATTSDYKLTLMTHHQVTDFHLLAIPSNINDSLPIYETLTATLTLKLEHLKQNTFIYEGIGANTSIKYAGDLHRFLNTNESTRFQT